MQSREGGERLQKTSGEGSGCRGGAASWERSQTLAGVLGLHGENHPQPFLAIPGTLLIITSLELHALLCLATAPMGPAGYGSAPRTPGPVHYREQ